MFILVLFDKLQFIGLSIHFVPNKKAVSHCWLTALQFKVGVTGFEPATTRPPDAYSNRAELHPELRVQKYGFLPN